MPLKMIREDIVRLPCDAIVNPTNEKLLPGGGTDAAIHKAAGDELFAACAAIGSLVVGEAKATPAFRLPSRYVIHTVGPVWCGGNAGEEQQLRSCYAASLALALDEGLESIAFPLISSGSYGYPKEQVLRVAVSEIERFLAEHDMLVYLVIFDKTAYDIGKSLYDDITAFIDDTYTESGAPFSQNCSYSFSLPPIPKRRERGQRAEERSTDSLEYMLEHMDKGFAETLFFYVDQKGLTDVECYKRANVDKKTFSKIKCNKNYKPSKVTAVSFAIALHLSLEETKHLLRTVGMTLSRSHKFDVIIEYFLTTGNYESIYDVNEVLFRFDQVTLGC